MRTETLESWILEVLHCYPKGSRLCCRSFPRKGEVFAYGGGNQNLKDLKETACRMSCLLKRNRDSLTSLNEHLFVSSKYG